MTPNLNPIPLLILGFVGRWNDLAPKNDVLTGNDSRGRHRQRRQDQLRRVQNGHEDLKSNKYFTNLFNFQGRRSASDLSNRVFSYYIFICFYQFWAFCNTLYIPKFKKIVYSPFLNFWVKVNTYKDHSFFIFSASVSWPLKSIPLWVTKWIFRSQVKFTGCKNAILNPTYNRALSTTRLHYQS